MLNKTTYTGAAAAFPEQEDGSESDVELPSGNLSFETGRALSDAGRQALPTRPSALDGGMSIEKSMQQCEGSQDLTHILAEADERVIAMMKQQSKRDYVNSGE